MKGNNLISMPIHLFNRFLFYVQNGISDRYSREDALDDLRQVHDEHLREEITRYRDALRRIAEIEHDPIPPQNRDWLFPIHVAKAALRDG